MDDLGALIAKIHRDGNRQFGPSIVDIRKAFELYESEITRLRSERDSLAAQLAKAVEGLKQIAETGDVHKMTIEDERGNKFSDPGWVSVATELKGLERANTWGWDGNIWVAYYWFNGWDNISLGLHVCASAPNIEIHLPFGFIRIGRRSDWKYREQLESDRRSSGERE